ncbi:MAG: M23 family metallopeptidase [Chthoniobacterales bacterium]|nr:M23 family metallopeptidase [Chthoniobacterales bacterium]
MNLSTSKSGTSAGVVLLFFAVFACALAAGLYFRFSRGLLATRTIAQAFDLASPLDLASLPSVTRFDFPLGSEHGAFAYNAQPFTQNRHLGDDLNGIAGENSDLGDSVHAVADGRVIWAAEGGPGWGKIIILLHALEENGGRRYVQSYYAHLDTIMVAPRQDVRRGEQIATVGNADGLYWAHLHFEMRDFITPFIGPGYREETRGWLNPTEFIQQHRGAPDDDVGRAAW